jgi:hypothetical protein
MGIETETGPATANFKSMWDENKNDIKHLVLYAGGTVTGPLALLQAVGSAHPGMAIFFGICTAISLCAGLIRGNSLRDRLKALPARPAQAPPTAQMPASSGPAP